jgi:hypothetical protein
VWDIITDTDKWPQWGPTVKQVRFPERFIRKGAKGKVLTSINIWLPFEIVDYEHARLWTWKVASVNATGHRIQAVDARSCDLWFDVPLMAAPYTLICRMALARIEKLLSGNHETNR